MRYVYFVCFSLSFFAAFFCSCITVRVDIAEWSGVQVAKFDHLACFTGGMYALGAVNLRGEVAADKQEIPDRRM